MPEALREHSQERLIALPAVAPHDTAHRRIRLERGRIDRDGLTLEQPRLHQPDLHPREHRAVRLEVDQAPRPGNRRVIGRGLVQRQPQETADRERIGRAPGNAAFRVEALEVADQQQPEVAPRRQARPPHDRGIEAATQVFDEPIEIVGIEDGTEPHVERMTGRLR